MDFGFYSLLIVFISIEILFIRNAKLLQIQITIEGIFLMQADFNQEIEPYKYMYWMIYWVN